MGETQYEMDGQVYCCEKCAKECTDGNCIGWCTNQASHAAQIGCQRRADQQSFGELVVVI